MVLKLTSEEVQEVRRALAQAHAALLRELSNAIGCGYSVANIELCGRKASISRLLDRLDNPVLLVMPTFDSVSAEPVSRAA